MFTKIKVMPDGTKFIFVSELRYGDILEFERIFGPLSYVHCGIYVGDKTVIHIGMRPGVTAKEVLLGKWNNDIKVRVDNIEDVARDSNTYRNNMLDTFFSPSKDQLFLRVMAKYGKADYNLIYNNCQHFCTSARYDIAFSRQADFFIKGFSSKVLTEDFTRTRVLVCMDDVDEQVASTCKNCNMKDPTRKEKECLSNNETEICPKDRSKADFTGDRTKSKGLELMNHTDTIRATEPECEGQEPLPINKTDIGPQRYTEVHKKPRALDLMNDTYWTSQEESNITDKLFSRTSEEEIENTNFSDRIGICTQRYTESHKKPRSLNLMNETYWASQEESNITDKLVSRTSEEEMKNASFFDATDMYPRSRSFKDITDDIVNPMDFNLMNRTSRLTYCLEGVGVQTADLNYNSLILNVTDINRTPSATRQESNITENVISRSCEDIISTGFTAVVGGVIYHFSSKINNSAQGFTEVNTTPTAMDLMKFTNFATQVPSSITETAIPRILEENIKTDSSTLVGGFLHPYLPESIFQWIIVICLIIITIFLLVDHFRERKPKRKFFNQSQFERKYKK